MAVVCLGDRWHKREHNLHHVSRGSQEDARHQASLPRHDRQEHEEVLHLRGPGPGRQECAAEVPCEQLPGQRNFSAILQYLFAENVPRHCNKRSFTQILIRLSKEIFVLTDSIKDLF